MNQRVSNQNKPRIAVWNSPRAGGPLRWSKDLVWQINNSGKYSARLVTDMLGLLKGHVIPQADLIHAAVPITYRGWRKPYVLTVKGDYTIEKNFWKLLYPRAIRMADRVTVPSHYLIERIPALAEAVVIPNAVDLSQFTPTTQPTGQLIKILVVTNFWFPEKARGVEQLLKLIKSSLTDHESADCQVTIVGDGTYLEKIKKQTKQYKFKTIFPGWSDPRKYFPATNIFLYYSFHDNMPNAVLEAMAAGLPVITNNVGAIPEMIKHGQDGLIAQSDDEYVSFMVELMNQEQRRRQIGLAARRRIETDFAWDRVILKYLDLYQTLLV